MTVIESPTNPLIKEIAALKQKKDRVTSGYLLVEGQHPIEEAFTAGLTCQYLFQLETEKNLASFPHEITWVSDRAMSKMATTDSPPPVLAVFQKPRHSLQTMLKQSKSPLILVLLGLQDPGNLGTLIRSAAAFGCDGVVTLSNAVDPYSPKVIRSSAGMCFALPVIEVTEGPEELLRRLMAESIHPYLTTSHEGKTQSYRDVSYCEGCAIVMGTEGSGLPETILKQPFTQISIPMASRVESLNVGVSGSIILAEASAQRGMKG